MARRITSQMISSGLFVRQSDCPGCNESLIPAIFRPAQISESRKTINSATESSSNMLFWIRSAMATPASQTRPRSHGVWAEQTPAALIWSAGSDYVAVSSDGRAAGRDRKTEISTQGHSASGRATPATAALTAALRWSDQSVSSMPKA